MSQTDASSRTIRTILHGKQAEEPMVRAAVETLRAEGHDVDVRVTWEAGHAGRFAQEAMADGIDTVIAAGGDGTINEVVQGLLQDAGADQLLPSLGIVPLGTANDFARASGIPVESLEAMRLVIDQPAVPVDVGRVGEHYFVNMATGGFGTEVTVSTPDELKKVLGGAAYLLTGLAQSTSIRPVEARFEGPDFEWEGSLLVLAVGNGRMAGGGHLLCPEAFVNDGAFDVRIIPAIEGTGLGEVLGALLKGGVPALDTGVVKARVPWLSVEAPGGLHVNLDGEPICDTVLRFEILPGRLRMHLPKHAPVLHR